MSLYFYFRDSDSDYSGLNISDEISDLRNEIREVRQRLHEIQPKTDNLKSQETKQTGLKFRGITIKSIKLSSVWNVLWRTTDNFWKRTTISGLSNARKSNSGFRRTIWMTLLTVFSILTFNGLSNVIDDFKRYPITTSVTVKHNDQVRKNVLGSDVTFELNRKIQCN